MNDPKRNYGDPVVKCMERYNITLPRNAIEWRIDGRVGTHLLFANDVTCLLTDGNVCWLALGTGEMPSDVPLCFAQLANFVESKRETPDTDVSGKPQRAGAPRGPSKRLVALADED